MTDPLGLAGYALCLVFGIVGVKARANKKTLWLMPAACALAAACVLGGLALAYHQQSVAAASLKPASPPPPPSMEVQKIDQKVKNGNAVAGVQGDVNINSQPPTKKSKPRQ